MNLAHTLLEQTRIRPDAPAIIDTHRGRSRTTTFAELDGCLPPYVTAAIRQAIPSFAARVRGFAMPDALLTGVETRSSSPVRINRDDQLMSSIQGIYPVGEGAGYAGGIMSSAVDGIRVAEKIVSCYKPFS